MKFYEHEFSLVGSLDNTLDTPQINSDIRYFDNDIGWETYDASLIKGYICDLARRRTITFLRGYVDAVMKMREKV